VWFATVVRPSGGAAELKGDPRTQLLERFGRWHAPIPALIEETPPEAIICDDAYGHTCFERFSTPRATLLGDAAHGVSEGKSLWLAYPVIMT
jgi:2-polyprenyl-6-methoxyphenol hydroxylase-like FAD-dependent oxidoreductase